MTATGTGTGAILNLTATEALTAGQGYLVGDVMFGVVADAAAIGEKYALVRRGTHVLPRNAAFTPSVGDGAWWDPAAEELIASATDAVFAGHVVSLPSATTLEIDLAASAEAPVA